MNSIMEDRKRFPREYLLCIFCLEFNSCKNQKCQKCRKELIISKRQELLSELENILFYGYQQRITIEKFIDRARPGDPIPSSCHLCYSEIFEYLVALIISGASWDMIKYVTNQIWRHFKNGKIKFDNKEIKTVNSLNLSLLEKLVNDEKELKKLVRYLNDYKNGKQDLDPRISEETKPINNEVFDANREILNELLKNVKGFMDEVD